MSQITQKLLDSYNNAKQNVGPGLVNVGKSILKSFYNQNSGIGKAYGTLANNTFNAGNLQREAETARLMQDIGARRQARGMNGLPYYNSSQNLYSNISNQYQNQGNAALQAQRDAKVGAFNNTMTIAGAGSLGGKNAASFSRVGIGAAKPLFNAAIGGVVGGATSFLDPNKTFAQGVGEGIGTSLKYNTLNNLVSPYTTSLAEGLLPVGSNIAKRVIARQVGAGLGNLAENQIDTRFTQQRPPTLSENAFSFLMGSAGEALNQAMSIKNGQLPRAENSLFEITPNRKVRVNPKARDELGRFANEIGVPLKEAKKQVVQYVNWYNERIPEGQMKVTNSDGTTKMVTRYVKRGEAGFIRLGSEDMNIPTTNEPIQNPTLPLKPDGSIDRTKLSGSQLSTPNSKLLEQANVNQSMSLPESIGSTAREIGVSAVKNNKIMPNSKAVDNFPAQMDRLNANLPEDPSIAGKIQPTPPDQLVTPQKQAIDQANVAASMDGKNGVNSFVDSLKSSFEDWVNGRRASKVQGTVAAQQFKNLDSKGINGIFEVQAGNKSPEYAPLRSFFDDLFKKVEGTGIEINYQKEYLPQLWANTPEEVSQVFEKKLSTRPGFSMDKIIEDYQAGIQAGLTPKFNKISDLTGWYAQRANKVIADKTFFNSLIDEKYILPSSKAPQDWVTVNPDRFPKYSVNTPGGEYTGTYKAPKNLADQINNYLSTPDGVLSKIADYTSRAKNITLSFGIPGTGINAHGVNILARHTLFGTGGNPVTRFLTGASYMLHPQSAVKFLDKELVNAPIAVKNGLTLSVEDHTALLNEAETVAKTLGKKWAEKFEAPLFNKMIPALKLNSYQELVKNGVSAKEAAKLINNVYGGINYEQIGRDRNTQDLLRAIILAPDWAETTLRLGKNILTAGLTSNKEVRGRYMAMSGTLLGSIVAANVANKLSSGHYMYENDPGHTFEIEAGYTSNGQKRYIRPYGTAVDFVRLPFDAAIGIAKGDPSSAFKSITNRLSMPLSSAMHLGLNTDYQGNRIYGKDKYGKDIPLKQAVGGIGSEAIGFVGFPSVAKNAIDVATGKQGLEQGLTQGMELPFRYSGGSFTGKDLEIANTLGVKGKDAYDLSKELKGQAAFSDKQTQVIKQGGRPALDAIIQKRAIDNQKDELKKQIESGVTSSSKFGNVSDVGTVSADEGKKSSYVLAGDRIVDVKNLEKIDLPKYTGRQNLDKEMYNAYSSNITQKKNDVEAMFSAGLIDADVAEQLLVKLDALREGAKVNSSTGSKKTISDAQLLSAYKKMLNSAVNNNSKASKVRSVQIKALPKLKRQKLTRLKRK